MQKLWSSFQNIPKEFIHTLKFLIERKKKVQGAIDSHMHQYLGIQGMKKSNNFLLNFHLKKGTQWGLQKLFCSYYM